MRGEREYGRRRRERKEGETRVDQKKRRFQGGSRSTAVTIYLIYARFGEEGEEVSLIVLLPTVSHQRRIKEIDITTCTLHVSRRTLVSSAANEKSGNELNYTRIQIGSSVNELKGNGNRIGMEITRISFTHRFNCPSLRPCIVYSERN